MWSRATTQPKPELAARKYSGNCRFCIPWIDVQMEADATVRFMIVIKATKHTEAGNK
jgi:hypothetical protein